MKQREHHYYVYLLSSRTRVLYCGVTNSLRRRVEEHQAAEKPSFTEQYNCHRLVWFEHYRYINNALTREKQLKRWTRAKKIALIEAKNPFWEDLSKSWKEETKDLIQHPKPPA